MSKPDLTGTPNQITWAEEIRSKMLAGQGQINCPDLIGRRRNSLAGAQYRATKAIISKIGQQLVLSAIDDVLNQTSAEWWINNRFDAYNCSNTIYNIAYSIARQQRRAQGHNDNHEILRENRMRWGEFDNSERSE